MSVEQCDSELVDTIEGIQTATHEIRLIKHYPYIFLSRPQNKILAPGIPDVTPMNRSSNQAKQDRLQYHWVEW